MDIPLFQVTVACIDLTLKTYQLIFPLKCKLHKHRDPYLAWSTYLSSLYTLNFPPMQLRELGMMEVGYIFCPPPHSIVPPTPVPARIAPLIYLADSLSRDSDVVLTHTPTGKQNCPLGLFSPLRPPKPFQGRLAMPPSCLQLLLISRL